jgi:ketosteroid isomerase-like protein
VSREAIDVVRSWDEPFEGVDVIPFLNQVIELYESGGMDAVLAFRPKMGEVIDPEVDWLLGPFGTYHGHRGMVAYMRDWHDLWETYTYVVSRYEDLGDCVLSEAHVRARGRHGIDVEMRVWHLYEVRDGKIVWQAGYSERDHALHAAAKRTAALQQPGTTSNAAENNAASFGPSRSDSDR